MKATLVCIAVVFLVMMGTPQDARLQPAVRAERVAPRAVVPPHPWGVYAWGDGAGEQLNIPAEMPIRGVPITWHWPVLEPERGNFAFDREVRAPLERALARGHYTHLMMWVAPRTPEWLFKLGVPRVEVPERINPFRASVKPTFPYYFSPVYKENFHRAIRALADYIAALPKELKERIVFMQVAEGSTGDGQPYKGTPLDSRYAITEEQWGQFRRETWSVYQAAYQRADGSLRVPLLVNGDANDSQENAWLVENCDVFGVKQGMFSHGYLVSDTVARLVRWEQIRAAAKTRGAVIFSRGEQDGEWKVCGWSKQNPPRAFYWSALFALHCKLDVWNVPADALATQPLGETVRLFNRYAGYNEPDGSPVAFCALRRGLDASDISLYPEARFGRAVKSNRDRYLAIALAFAPHGARQGDPDKALGGGMRNRQADDQNDVGWGIWPGNFERHLTQLRPEETSVALWHVGPATHAYSLFARRFDAATGRAVMRFQLARGFFADPARPHAVSLRIAYLDRGKGAWELVYATPKGPRVARKVELADSGEWRDLRIELPDALWDGRLEGGGDFALRHAGGADAVFHLIELARSEKPPAAATTGHLKNGERCTAAEQLNS